MTLTFVGPELSAGPLPTVFYFALSAKETLFQDPFNQPVALWQTLPMRIFSLTLPEHEGHLEPNRAVIALWQEELAKGRNLIKEFTDQAAHEIHKLKQAGLLLPEQLAVAGLSRGAFMATHLAALVPDIRTILGFAPLTGFPDLPQHDLIHLIPQLTDRTLRFYIGNCDHRVGTSRCFNFVQQLAEAALHRNIRSPSVELIITPSIGHQGHGTSKKIFEAGARFLADQLGVSNG